MTGIKLNSLLSLQTGALQVSLKITVRNAVFFLHMRKSSGLVFVVNGSVSTSVIDFIVDA